MRNLHRLPLFLTGIGLVTALALAACGGSDDDDPAAADPSPTTIATATVAPSPTVEATPTAAASADPAPPAVSIIDFGYSPSRLAASAGSELTLNVTNTGNVDHTFTIAGLVDSGDLGSGAGAQLTFTPTEAGTLVFFCTIHGEAVMSGDLVVTAAGSTN
jgi:plastocyanin